MFNQKNFQYERLQPYGGFKCPLMDGKCILWSRKKMVWIEMKMSISEMLKNHRWIDLPNKITVRFEIH